MALVESAASSQSGRKQTQYMVLFKKDDIDLKFAISKQLPISVNRYTLFIQNQEEEKKR